MIEFLKEIFGTGITEFEYSFPNTIPYYLCDGYHVSGLRWNSYQCLVLQPIQERLNIAHIKKHLNSIEEATQLPCALALKNLNSQQRKSLIQGAIPFISTQQQIFLPFWGCILQAYLKKTTPSGEMPALAQLCFLYLYYRTEETPLSANELVCAVSTSKASGTRAIEWLYEHQLIHVNQQGRFKLITVNKQEDSLKRAFKLMKSPVIRTVYVASRLISQNALIGGIQALTDRSLLNAKETEACQVISKHEDIKGKIIHDDFLDDNKQEVQIWSYNPKILSQTEYVDDISLLLSLMNIRDERIEAVLDQIREKYGIPSQ